MKNQFTKRLLSLLLVLSFVLGFAVPVGATRANAADAIQWRESDIQVSPDLSDRQAAEQQETKPCADTDSVRVSIHLDGKSTLQAGFSTQDIATNEAAMAYDAQLLTQQQAMVQTISTEALNGEELDVVWNMTLVGNIISANVLYGQMEAIAAVPGVKSVVLEQQHEPQVVAKEETANPERYASGGMVGSHTVWSNGYTGAGSRIAVIDTGTDTSHQSFDGGAFVYALEQNAKEKGLGYEAYFDSLNLLDKYEIADVLQNLNVYERNANLKAEDLYRNEKLAFGYNYIDNDLDLTHLNDKQGEHGSHVAGIATANRYIPQGEGYADAVETVLMAGVAPDAQLLTMKVFGKAGGAYDSDYMAAIEDAIWLGADSVNLSLNTVSPGFTYDTTYNDLLEYLQKSDLVMVNSAGNSSYWAEHTQSSASAAYLYNDDVNFATGGSPGSYKQALAVASVDNDGSVGYYFSVGEKKVVYNEGINVEKATFNSLDISADGTGTEYDYIFVTGYGVAADFEGIDLTGKVVFCSRGSNSFYMKANEAASRGAIATIIYNNQAGTINMDMTGYTYSAPAVSILKSEGAAVKALSQEQTTENGLTYYTGKIKIFNQQGAVSRDSQYYTMSSFSSWGVPGSLELKPEITAPGGSIYSVYGTTPSGGGADQYELMSGTSMAAPQVTGMVALVAQYLRENGLEKVNGMSNRDLATSLLMSTAVPMLEEANGYYYSLLTQGAGLSRVDLATTAESYIRISGREDGKVKAELGDDPQREGVYTFSFSVNNLNGAEMDYALDADVFTQNVFEDNDGYLRLDTWTKALPADVTFSVDGQTVLKADEEVDFDVNGDGKTDKLDADFLLEYLLGNETELKANGDVNGNGVVNTYDAHLLLAMLDGKSCITVPANGSVTVEVTIRLGEEIKTYLDTYHPNGAYIESYVFAEPVTDAEGNKGVTHSIPVLAFYGGWTESSMFDKLSYVESAYGLTDGDAYLEGLGYSIGGTIKIAGDYLTVDYGDGNEYYWGGNPVEKAEAEYLPRRNALNNQTSMLVKYGNTQIRNSVASRLVITDAETGEVYYQQEMGQIVGAYYYTNGGVWRNYTFNTRLDWAGTDMEGNKLPEGTTVELTYIAAPDYYVSLEEVTDEDGNTTYEEIVNWDALGEGAYDAISMTIDNTAPTVSAITMDVLSGSGLLVTAKDNQYVSSVVMLNEKGTGRLAIGHANQTEPNTEVTVELDVSGASGNKFLIAVYDYAMNATVYEIELGLSNEKPKFTAIEYDYVDDTYNWLGFDAEGDPSVLGSFKGNRILAAEYVDGYVFMVDGNYNLFVAPDDDLGDFRQIGSMGIWMQDMAYNPADGKLYGLYYRYKSGKNNVFIGEIDMYMGTLTDIANYPYNNFEYSLETPQILGMTIDNEGTFYAVQYSSVSGSARKSDFFTFTVDSFPNMTYIGSDPLYGSHPTHLAWDHDTNELYGLFNFNTDWLAKIDTKTGEVTKVRDVTPLLSTSTGALSGLYIRPTGDNGKFAPTNKVREFALSATKEQTMVGNTVQLSATIKPWNIADETILWSSSDETIATVDENGVVYGVSAGTVTITGAPKVDPSFTATCTITVKELDANLNAVIWDEDGKVWWSEFNTKTVPSYTKLTEEPAAQDFAAVTQLADGTIYAATLDTNSLLSDLYQIDPKTLVATKLGGSSSVAYFDLTHAPNLGEGGTLLAVYGPYILLIDPATGEYTGAWEWSSGANLVSIAYAGSGKQYVFDAAWNMHQVTVDYLYLVDADGNVYYDYFFALEDSYYYGYGQGSAKKGSFNVRSDSLYFSSAYYLPANKMLVWAGFNKADNNVKLMAFDTSKNRGYSLGKFADGVWPVAGLTVLNREIPEEGQSINETMPTGMGTTTVDISEVEAYAASLRAGEAQKMSTAGYSDTDKVITVEVTAQAETSNGRMTINFNQKDLTFASAVGVNEAFAYTVKDGVVEIAYAADKAMAKDGKLATLTFKPTDTAVDSTTVTVKQGECNDTVLDVAEVLEIALPHKYTAVVTEPTCTECGYTTYTCAGCGESYVDDYTEAKGHSFGAWTTVTAPTCTEKGEESRTCDLCGETEKREVAAKGHDYVAVVTKPTCTEAGYTTYTCSVCGDSYLDDVTNPTGHKFGAWTVVKEATCTEDGLETRVCSCGEAENREIRAAGHNWSDWTVTTPATCTEKGVETRTCANCGETETRPTEAYGHNWSDWSVTKAATCTEKGEEIRTCAGCGETEKRAIDALGHDCTSVTVPATCTTDGYTEYTCKVCGHTYREDIIPATGHNYGAAVTAPTCTDKGYTTYTCKNCGDTYITDYVDALGHAFSEWKVTKAATCTGEGTETRTCACGETEERAIPATGHSFGDWEVTTPATCTKAGVETRTCACGETETRAIAALGHEQTSKVVAPTCTEDGYTEYTCSVCGYSYREDIVPALGHEYEATVVAPTCTEVGYTEYTCQVCGDSYVTDYVPATGHSFGEWIITTEPGCNKAGIETRYCDCGETETREIPAVCPAGSFTDVDTRQWYHEGICFVIRNGLMKGKGDGIFAPNANLTRAELVAVLYRMAGEPSVEGLEHPFTDVPAGQWYSEAITWAYNAEVVNGMTETTFAPGANITREQIATILYRFAEAEAVEEDALTTFSDADKVSAYAVDAMNWAVDLGLINGMGDGTLAPQGSATRAQIATILMRYCETIAE